MRAGWAGKSLGDACEVVAGQSPAGSAYNFEGKGLPFYQGKKEFKDKFIGPPATWTTEVTKRAKADDILMSVRAPVGPINLATQEVCIGRGLAAIRAKPGLDQNFLFYFLLSIQPQISGRDGAVFPSISRSEICSISLSVPPLPEQQRIVAILDEVFAGLATAAANAEKNLENARELFGSQLSRVFERTAQRHRPQRLAEIVTRLTNGYVGPTRNIYHETGVPYLLARHVRDNRLEFDGKTYVSGEFNEKNKKSKLKAGDVLLVQSGHIGHSAVVGPEHEGHNCHAMIVITPVPNELRGDFLSFYFGSAEMKRKFEEIRSGSTVPHLTCGLIRELMIPLPAIDQQRKIVASLKEMEQYATKLTSHSREKLFKLAQLKQSILCKAFSGKLTNPIAIILSRPSVSDIRRDTALMIALAYERHKQNNRDKSFRHTKEQKILHMVEAEAGFNLGRQPIRDAAGPNDFRHMLDAEEWAEGHRYFRVSEHGTGYQFQPLARFSEFLNSAKSIDSATRKKIERVIDVFIPMDAQEAEVFATAYAAWNNILHEGKTPTEDAIIEACYAWHPKKAEIARSKFVEALHHIRSLGMQPTGRAPYVPPPAQGQLAL